MNQLNPDTWLMKYGDYLFSIAMLKINNREVAEDLVQESFLSAYKSKDAFRGDSSEKTWLVSILNNKIIDYYRKKDVLKNTSEYIMDTEKSFTDSFFTSTLFSDAHWSEEVQSKNWSPSADDELIKTDFQQILEKCISKLPSKLIPVFVSKFIDETDSDSICKEFGITSSNYWVIVHRAKILMRACLDKNWLYK